jgi:adenylate cyclase
MHKGPAIIGEMGYGQTRSLTALGDTVNVASRLQKLAKSHQCELVVSEDVLRSAGLNLPNGTRHEMEIRGRGATIAIYTVAAVRELPAEMPGSAADPARKCAHSRTSFEAGARTNSARNEGR